ncbi:hypothetical protein TYRP_005458 [Tyrophagus putrescentiae]|nr:hypothetical protein TYRP_005458 [Tyrophagus putrescentiae]
MASEALGSTNTTNTIEARLKRPKNSGFEAAHCREEATKAHLESSSSSSSSTQRRQQYRGIGRRCRSTRRRGRSSSGGGHLELFAEAARLEKPTGPPGVFPSRAPAPGQLLTVSGRLGRLGWPLLVQEDSGGDGAVETRRRIPPGDSHLKTHLAEPPERLVDRSLITSTLAQWPLAPMAIAPKDSPSQIKDQWQQKMVVTQGAHLIQRQALLNGLKSAFVDLQAAFYSKGIILNTPCLRLKNQQVESLVCEVREMMHGFLYKNLNCFSLEKNGETLALVGGVQSEASLSSSLMS